MSIENLRVIAAGRDSAFWKAMQDELLFLRMQALDALVNVPPEKWAEVCEQQQIIRMVNQVISLVDGSAEELRILEEE